VTCRCEVWTGFPDDFANYIRVNATMKCAISEFDENATKLIAPVAWWRHLMQLHAPLD
jgi:hypothetical protein